MTNPTPATAPCPTCGKEEGSIYQRASDGKWCASVDLGWQDGTRRRKVVYGGAVFDVSARITGDWLLCSLCDRWCLLIFRAGGVIELVPVVPHAH